MRVDCNHMFYQQPQQQIMNIVLKESFVGSFRIFASLLIINESIEDLEKYCGEKFLI